MKLSIMLAAAGFRGDHSAEVRIAIAHIPGETLEQLIERIPVLVQKQRQRDDVIEIRVAIEKEEDTPL